jgi:hypothetical protein
MDISTLVGRRVSFYRVRPNTDPEFRTGTVIPSHGSGNKSLTIQKDNGGGVRSYRPAEIVALHVEQPLGSLVADDRRFARELVNGF